jgi:hypothetical protein
MANALEGLGHDVWWDHDIEAGKDFGTEIQQALDRAACVVVLWSQESVKSRWVLDESEEGLQKERLVPVLIDDVKPPMGYRRIEAANLAGWSGSQDDPEFQVLVKAIGRHSSQSPTTSVDTVAAVAEQPAPLVDGITQFPPPEPTPESSQAPTAADSVGEPIRIAKGLTEGLKGKRVRIVHSKARKRDAVSALQILQTAGASATLGEIGLGVHDSHRGAVYFHDDRDVALVLTGLFDHVEGLTPRHVEDPLAENDLAMCLVEQLAPPPTEAKGIRGLKVRLLYAKELRENAMEAVEFLQRAGAIPTLDSLARGQHIGNRGKVHFHRDAASARVVAETLGRFGSFAPERIEGSGAAFEIVAWFLPATLD